jgi:hypothetical protein
MKINKDDAALYGKVSPELARKLQPLIQGASTEHNLDRRLVQSALLYELEGTSARIGVATAQRLLKDPKYLVSEYERKKSVSAAKRQSNFDQDLRGMISHVAKTHPEDTFKELKSKFPNSRNFADMQRAAALHVQNGGRPLTVVPVPLDAVIPTHGPGSDRYVNSKEQVILLDGEGIVFLEIKGEELGRVILGPIPAKELSQKLEGRTENREVYQAPPVPQMTMEF